MWVRVHPPSNRRRSNSTLTRTRFFLLSAVVLLSLLWAVVRVEAPSYLEFLELRITDFRLQARGLKPVGNKVAIVGIDEKSLRERGRWPWRRSEMANLISALTELGASVIALDIVFAEPSGPEEDRQLAAAIRTSGKVVLGYFLDFGGGGAVDGATEYLSSYNLVRPPHSPGLRHVRLAPNVVPNLPLFSEAARRAGYFNFAPDADGVFRQGLLATRYQDRILTPLSLEALRLYMGNPLLSITFEEYGAAEVRLGDKSIPTDESGEMWINYAGPAHIFPHYSATDVLNNLVPREKIAGKIILVGATATGVFDLRATPFDPVYPGVEIHATVIDNVLNNEFLSRPKWIAAADIGIILVLGLGLGTALVWMKGMWGFLATAAVLLAYFWGSQFVFVRYGVTLSGLYPPLAILSIYLAVTLGRYMTEEREKRRVRAAFGLYLHPEVARMVSDDPSLLRLGGKKEELTVMFTDIRGFTSISETLDPVDLVEFLNEYLGAMTDIVFEYDGLLDKYIGDAIMALWGAPIRRPNHAALACRTALDMREKLAQLQVDWRDRGLPPIEMGVGINTGPMVVGNMGSYRRFNYTVMGDHVNLASRLEGLNKLYDTRVLISENTRAQIGDEFLLREIDSVRVKGKVQPALIYELLSRADSEAELRPLVKSFTEAIKTYKDRQWEQALQLFSRLKTSYPNDGPTLMYIERSRLFLESPPGSDWDGVFTATTK